jgi:hypothetical protein
MALPDRRRLPEYALKGLHLAGRQVAWTPELRQARRLAAQAETVTDASGPRVVFFTMRGWRIHVHWEAVIAQALRRRGADVRFVTCGGGLGICDRTNTYEGPPMPCRSCTRYVHDALDAHGMAWQTLRDGWEADDPGEWPELDGMTLGELIGAEADGLPLGDLAAIPVAWFLLRTDYHEDPLAAPTWRDFLRSARRVARGVRAALDRLQPDVVVLLNGLFLFESIAWAICRERGIDVVTYERGFIKDTLLFRRNEVAAHLRLDDIWPRFAAQPLTDDESARLDAYLEDRRHGRRTIERYWEDVEFSAPDANGEGRLVAAFPNITWDSAVIGQTEAFDAIQDWLVATVELFAARPQDRLVIRLHPAEVKLTGKQTRESLADFLAERYPVLPSNVRVVAPDDNTSSYPLMEACDVGLVFTSTVGLELALAGKPVVVAGRTHYRDKGFTLDADSPGHYEKVVEAVLDDPAGYAPALELARRYAYLFFFRTPIDAPGVEEHVTGLCRLTVRDLDELAPGRDEMLDRICDGILGHGDFLPREDG